MAVAMTRPRQTEVADALRRRIRRALQVRAIAPGDRLPGTRELAAEFDADPRVVADAYRLLATEGLVELRPRSGVYVSPTMTAPPRRAILPPEWMIQVFAASVAHGVPIPELAPSLMNALGKTPLRAVVMATTSDQSEGLSRELREDYGIDARSLAIDALPLRGEVPRMLSRAHLLVTTEAHVGKVAQVAKRLEKEFVTVTVRPDLFGTEWMLLRGMEAYVIVADQRFARLVREYLESVDAHQSVHILIAGQDDLSAIGPEVPVYATQAARDRIGVTRLPPGILPPARMLSDDCTVAIVRAMLNVRLA